MKKNLLLVTALIASQVSFGQLTQTNEPAIGASLPMYKVTDTATVSSLGMLGVTGNGVTWDYSSVVMETAASGVVGVTDASTDTHAAEFPTSTKVISQGTIQQFFNSTSSARTSQGFVFNEPTFGEIVVVLDSDEAIQLTYPFAYGNSNADNYAGSTELNIIGPVTAAVTGDVYSSIDGTGTLQLADNQIANVFRLTTIDTTLVDVPSMMQVEVIRRQMEYYDLSDVSSQNLPIFVDAYISISGMGKQREVLSKYYATAGLENNTINNVVVFPNPSAGEFTISGEFAKANVEVTDVAGKVVYAAEINNGSKVKLNNVNAGVYFVKIAANNKTAVQKITIK